MYNKTHITKHTRTYILEIHIQSHQSRKNRTSVSFRQASLATRVLRSTRADPSARCIDELSDCHSDAPGHITAGWLSPMYRAEANEMRTSYIAPLTDLHQASQLTDQWEKLYNHRDWP